MDVKEHAIQNFLIEQEQIRKKKENELNNQ